MKTSSDKLIRKIQQFGAKGSFILTLPKQWCQKYEINSQDEVIIHIDKYGAGSLFVSLADTEESSRTEVVEINYNEFEKNLSRAILSRFLDGSSTIKIFHVPLKKQMEVEREVEELITNKLHRCWLERGFMIQVSRDISHPKELIQDIFESVKGMIEYCIDAVIKNDIKIAEEVIIKDNTVDKYYFYLVRTLKIILREPLTYMEYFNNEVFALFDAMNYRMIGSYLENLADVTEDLCRQIADLTLRLQVDEVNRFKIISYDLLDIFVDSFTSFMTNNEETAIISVERAESMTFNIEDWNNYNKKIYYLLNEIKECVIDICQLVSE
ncbi:MAG: hypothetical protein OEZ01_04835 [Candidatus Heimdallarchaeota archaeon]|nr:hypothetical protein [Candidatus Heimdallarchaeota archaeon]MDH5645307.1 hypothetical protein [Candidatus Heimdallarchaeota archaeon]